MTTEPSDCFQRRRKGACAFVAGGRGLVCDGGQIRSQEPAHAGSWRVPRATEGETAKTFTKRAGWSGVSLCALTFELSG